MSLIGSIICFILGILFLLYALNVPAFMAGQYFILGFILIGSGVALYIYRGKKKKSKASEEES